MKLNIIYGRSGSGKSTYIYEAIKKETRVKNIFMIVPEQSNLSAERNLFAVTGKTSLLNIEVLSLSRMAYRVANEIGVVTEHLSNVGKDMLIFDLLTQQKAHLNFLGKSDKNVDMVARMLTEFKKHHIHVDDLKKIAIDNTYTQLKLQDIRLLYEQYEERIRNQWIDENDILTILVQNFEQSHMFDNAIVYIDEFLGFTPQEYLVFEKLVEKCAEITVSVPTDALDVVSYKENDIFYFNKQFAHRLIDIATKKGAEIKKVHLEKAYRFQNEELAFLERNFFATKTAFVPSTKHIQLFIANHPYSELEYVAKTIYKLVKDEGYQYHEIGIITEDIEKYGEDAKVMLNAYEIPLFIDEKQELNQNILIKFIIAMLDIFVQNWSYETMLHYIKMGLLEIEKEDIYILENYCRKWGIKGKKWYEKPWDYEPINAVQEKLEMLRKKIVEPLLTFKEEVSGQKTVTEITKQIYTFLIENHIPMVLDSKLKSYNKLDITDQYNTSYRILIQVLEEICFLFKDEPISFQRYKELLQVGLNHSEIGKLPATQDQVILGDTERTRSNGLKVLFIIGVNDGSFPKESLTEGFLNDTDRQYLKEAGMELAKDSRDSLFEEQFNIYRTLTTPSEKLYISYAASDKQGKSMRPSILIKKLKRLFPHMAEESDIVQTEHQLSNYRISFEEALQVYKEYLMGKDISEEWETVLRYFYQKDTIRFTKALSGIYYTNQSQNIEKANIDRLYGNVLKTSVSQLESYRKCPFAFHLTYGLQLKERPELKMQAIDTGSFMHEVIDLFFKKLDEEEKNIKQIEKENISEMVDAIINQLLLSNRYYIFSSSAKFRWLTRRLKKVIVSSIEYIVYSLKYSDFSVLGHEVEFSHTGTYPPIKMSVEGKIIEITGKIDRVDIAQTKDAQYVRIIDYKSSAKDIDMNEVVSGLQIQLITYLDAICDKESFAPSGILYLGLMDNIIKADKNLPTEEIENRIRKAFKMKGLILADVSVVKMMDNTMKTGNSDIVPVYIGKEGEISEKKSSVIQKEDFENLQKKVKQIIRDMTKEILKGKITIQPYYYKKKTGCDYCAYKTICMFHTSIKGNEYYYIRQDDKDKILEEMKGKE